MGTQDRDELIRLAEEAEMRYARTGLTIDAEKAVAARRKVTPKWMVRLTAKDMTGRSA